MNPHYYYDEPAVLLIIILCQLIIQDCTCTIDKNKSHMMIIIVMVSCTDIVSHFHSIVILVSELSNIMVASFSTFCLSTTPSTMLNTNQYGIQWLWVYNVKCKVQCN